MVVASRDGQGRGNEDGSNSEELHVDGCCCCCSEEVEELIDSCECLENVGADEEKKTDTEGRRRGIFISKVAMSLQSLR